MSLGRLRTRIVLLVLLAGIVPLAGWGRWTLSSMRTTGEEVLRQRMRSSLADIGRSVGYSWIGVRSALVDLGESAVVQGALAGTLPEPGPADAADLLAGLDGLQDLVERVVVRSREGRVVLDLASTGPPAAPSYILPPVRLPVRATGSAERLGDLEVHLRSSSLLPNSVLVPTVSGSAFAVIDPHGGDGDLPLAMDASLLRRDRFIWGGEEWITARREISEPALVLAMAGPLSGVTRPLGVAESRALFGLLLTAALAVATALVVSGRLSSPLEDLAGAADRVAAGELHLRIRPGGPDEVARVGRGFNQMLASLEETLALAARRETLAAVGEFAASLAHEIRNPLTSVRLDLQRAVEGLDGREREMRLLVHALAEVGRLDRAVTGALRLARSGQVQRQPLDPVGPVREGMTAAAPAFARAGCTLEGPEVLGVREGPAAIAGPEMPAGELSVMGDPVALEQIVTNLLENALAALPPGGRAGVRLLVHDRRLHVEVWDRGRGMTPDELRRASDLLYTTRPEGTGLGLPLARRMAEAHGGSLELESRSGEGTVARVVLPLRSAGGRDEA